MNKKICIAVSTEKEINNEITNYIVENNIDIVYTGIGVPSTILNLTKYLNFNKPLVLINAGIAGAFAKSLKIGEVGLVVSDVFADFLLPYKNYEIKHIYETFEIYPIFTNNYNVSINLKQLNGITVNSLFYSNKIRDFYKKKFNPDIETMEGAAIMYVCKHYNINSICIRAISNYVGQKDRSKWNIKLAVENLSNTLLNILKNTKFYE
ncbi:MAG: hypothetical protein N3A01_06770 [Bacteroidales bacterium]|nr:hypothetical protein [Bacteroidales bacterium]